MVKINILPNNQKIQLLSVDSISCIYWHDLFYQYFLLFLELMYKSSEGFSQNQLLFLFV